MNALRNVTGTVALLALGAAATPALSCGEYGLNLETLVTRAVSGDEAVAAPARSTLRALGPRGLEALVEAHAERLDAWRRWLADPAGPADPSWRRLGRAVDTVGGQRDNFVSTLFWHTDLEQAKARAAATGRPILSLRLLGRLDEDLSCANSRFFRTALYANRDVATALRERFVLHWESVRPAPRLTIDFGDGRTIRRTLTGNSAHYVLDPAGRPVDVLPGLYGPGAFLEGLERAGRLAVELAAAPEAERPVRLREAHRGRLETLAASWQRDLGLVSAGSAGPEAAPQGDPPPAAVAAPVALTKAMVERPALAATLFSVQMLEGERDAETWKRIGRLYEGVCRLDHGSRLVMVRQLAAAPPGRRALERVVRRFEEAMAVDTARNEYRLHRRVHEWFAGAEGPADTAALDERIYAELFLTPRSDPWLGLLLPDTYAALDGNGVVVREGTKGRRHEGTE